MPQLPTVWHAAAVVLTAPRNSVGQCVCVLHAVAQRVCTLFSVLFLVLQQCSLCFSIFFMIAHGCVLIGSLVWYAPFLPNKGRSSTAGIVWTGTMGVTPLLILWRRDLLLTEVEKVIFYKSFWVWMGEKKMMTCGFLAAACSCWQWKEGELTEENWRRCY